jgi:hypothetical protein
MKCSFVVGQQVECVDDKWFVIFNDEPTPPPMPVKGSIYTVAAIVPGKVVIFVTLKEMGRRRGYDAGCFRPLQERKTDISIFLKMLNPAKRQLEKTP